MKNIRKRDYCFTLNLSKSDNILGLEIDEKEIIHSIYNKLVSFFNDEKLFKYVIFQLEIGEKEQHLHYQGYFYFNNPRTFSATKKLLIRNGFNSMHIEYRQAPDIIEAIDYCRKEDTRYKADYLPNGLSYEFGIIPSLEEENQGRRTDLELFIEKINGGATYDELLEEFPSYIVRYDKLYEKLRKKYYERIYNNKVRVMENYLYYMVIDSDDVLFDIYSRYGFDNVYRLPSYNRYAFDDYNNQDVIVLDNYDDQFGNDNFLLKLLSGFPLYLGARYENKVATFTKVIVITRYDCNYFAALNHIVDINKVFKNIEEGRYL